MEVDGQLTALYRILLLFISLLSLVSCAREDSRIINTSGGYLTSSNALRFWRTDSPDANTLIVTYSNPIASSETVKSQYYWKKQQLISINQQRDVPEPETTILRFDAAGQLTFMQRQRINAREALSATDISDLQHQARLLYAASVQARLTGARLRQGVWLETNRVMSCDKQPRIISMSAKQLAQLQKLAATAAPVYLSWLDSNRESKLLYSTKTNLCLPQNDPAQYAHSSD
jgi:hypothetical protein